MIFMIRLQPFYSLYVKKMVESLQKVIILYNTPHSMVFAFLVIK